MSLDMETAFCDCSTNYYPDCRRNESTLINSNYVQSWKSLERKWPAIPICQQLQSQAMPGEDQGFVTRESPQKDRVTTHEVASCFVRYPHQENICTMVTGNYCFSLKRYWICIFGKQPATMQNYDLMTHEKKSTHHHLHIANRIPNRHSQTQQAIHS